MVLRNLYHEGFWKQMKNMHEGHLSFRYFHLSFVIGVPQKLFILKFTQALHIGAVASALKYGR